ncbi:DUF3142 domain-containing protein, partial [Pyxidicoccus sp. 3LG]
VMRVDGTAPLDGVSLQEVALHARTWRARGVRVRGVEVDHDCATPALAGYADWLEREREALSREGLTLSITALPTWATSPEVKRLASLPDDVVVQVHAVRAPTLFTPEEARRFLESWSKATGRSFRVALPTYRVRLKDGTRLSAEPRDVSRFLDGLRERPVPGVAGVVWFRLGHGGDVDAWSFPRWRPWCAASRWRRASRPGWWTRAEVRGTSSSRTPAPWTRMRPRASPSMETWRSWMAWPAMPHMGLHSSRARRPACASASVESSASCGEPRCLLPCRSLFASLVVLMLYAPVRDAHACGASFPSELLSDRAGTLADLPDGAFSLEVSRLLPEPADSFQVMEHYEEPPEARTGGGARETALYNAGAKAWHAGDWETARARFLQVLELPPEERRRFSTFAAFMLARGSGAGLQHEARPRFAEVRELARQGFDDPLGLAVASLGEEARLLLEQGDDAGAIRLYAEQAAHGSGGATTSLLLVARAVGRDEARLREALKDPLAQRLMATFVWTRGQEWQWGDEPKPGGLTRILDALAAVPGLAGADRLAAGAWRVGRFDLAERFAGQENTPLASWVKAKLALRRGDLTSAEQHLAEAARGWPETEDWTGDSEESPRRPRTRTEGERGLLALLRGDFVQSAERMVASCTWPDLAYVAERVLTVDELQRLIAAWPPGTEERCAPEVANLWDDDAREGKNSLDGRLRLLLARRLLRAGEDARALEYFRGTPHEEPARRYVE